MKGRFLRFAVCILLILSTAVALAQQAEPSSSSTAPTTSPQSTAPEATEQKTALAPAADPSNLPDAPSKTSAEMIVPASKQQPKRILGVMPNFRAVSAGAIPPPPTPKQSFILATENSFDYSSFVFVGITSALAYGTNAHPQLGSDPSAYWGYYWRGFVDKTDGNYWVIFILPSFLHEDQRYFAMGEGGVWKRGTYAATRIFVAKNYQGKNTFNISELLGRAIAQGISTTYYPSQSNTGEKLAEKYAYALGRDALTNVFREFWPDIATHMLHRHP
jgi:hypothetical protein